MDRFPAERLVTLTNTSGALICLTFPDPSRMTTTSGLVIAKRNAAGVPRVLVGYSSRTNIVPAAAPDFARPRLIRMSMLLLATNPLPGAHDSQSPRDCVDGNTTVMVPS